MSILFFLTFLASFPALIAGLIRPKWVLPGVKRPTRKLAAEIYLSSIILSFFAAMISAASKPEEMPVTSAPVAPQPSPSLVDPKPSPSITQPTPSPSPSPAAVAPSAQPVTWRSQLPTEDAELRAKFEQDAFLKGWLSTQDVWIGHADIVDLQQRGFFVNSQWKSNGMGANSTLETTYGSCSAIGFDGEFACGVGAFDSPNWGVQSDGAIEAFKRFMRASAAPPPPSLEAIASTELVADSNLPGRVEKIILCRQTF